MTGLRLLSPLSPELEELIRRTIGAMLIVHRELGSGMSEAVYAAALRIELSACGIAFEARSSCRSGITVTLSANIELTCLSRVNWW